MTPAQYRATLVNALAKPGGATVPVLTLVGKATGLGARGTLLGTGPTGPHRSFTKADVRKMLAKLDADEAARARTVALMAGARRTPAGRLTVGCAPCSLSIDAPDTVFGRALIAAWPATHAKDCTA